MGVPLLDLSRQTESIRDELDEAIRNVLNECRFILGPDVAELESAVALYTGATFAVGCASGTDALMIALRAAGVSPGDDVITTAYSFYATAGAIWRIGARPVFVDIDRDTFNMDIARLKDAIGTRTAAVLPVHLFGQMCDMNRLRAAAGDLPIVEDSAQAMGSKWNNQPSGAWDIAACFSFFPSKNLGGFGDGGMIVTSDPAVAEHCRSLRVHGAKKTYHHEEVGYNSRLDTIQAAILKVKLAYLDVWTRRRREHAVYYDHAFAGTPIQTPIIADAAYSIYNQYVIRIKNRDAVMHVLKQREIGHAVYYPVPLPLQPCFQSLGYRPGDFPEAESAARESLAIPIFPEMTPSERDQVVEAVLAGVRG
ncbi:DegT/DnrJ/EryC1/StrS family aminotransferase [bacterium]|nr:DegT/DnrJ/EryC1/StrS family aminotransferase [candidate division CSSED10-310 bacterium]